MLRFICRMAFLLLLPLMFMACSGKAKVGLDDELSQMDAQAVAVKADVATFEQMKQLWAAEDFGELEKYARGVLANSDLNAEQRGLASYYLAYACLEQDQRREALLRSRVAFKLLPKNELAPALLLSLTELAFGGKDKAEKRLFQLQQAHPDSLEVLLTLARANEIESYFGRAAYWYGQAIELEEKKLQTRQPLGERAEQGATPPEAQPQTNICPEVDLPLADLYVKKALALWQAGDALRAIENMDAALALQPQDAAAWNDRGIINLALGKHKEALADFNRAIAANPSYLASFLNRSNYYVAEGRYDLALRDCRQGLEQRPDDAMLLVTEGQIYAAQNKYEKALKSFEAAYRSAPRNAQVLNELAWFLATCPNATVADPARAIILSKESVYLSKTPEPGNYDTLAAAFARAGSFEEAARAGETAVNLAKRAGLSQEIIKFFEKRLLLYKQFKSYTQ